METVREELGPDVDFAIEAHWRYDTRGVIQLGNALAHLKPMWLEDPVPPDNADAMARVAHAIGVPICTSENLYTKTSEGSIELQACAGRAHRYSEIWRSARIEAHRRSRGYILDLDRSP
jgi:gluconate/galactonate dehydratase